MRLLRVPLVGGMLSILLLSGCQRSVAPPQTFHWWAGRPAPAFDPDGPPEALRQNLERLLTRSLVAVDTLGRPVLDAAG